MPQLHCCKRAERRPAHPLPAPLPVLEPQVVVVPRLRPPRAAGRVQARAESGAIETGVAGSASPASGFSSHNLFSELRFQLSVHSGPPLMRFAPGTRCPTTKDKRTYT